MDIAIEKFSDFIVKTLAKESGKNTKIISFCTHLQNIELRKKVKFFLKYYEKSFYWCRPVDEFEFLGLGELISITDNGKGRFASSEKKIKTWLDNTVCNWNDLGLSNLPLFVGGVKFNSESNSTLWQDFQDSNWIVPKILLIKIKEQTYFIFNYILTPDSQKEKIVIEYNQKIKFISEEKPETTTSNGLKILTRSGNTPKEKKRWIDNCKKAILKIETGELQKIVLSRYIELSFSEEPDICPIMEKLRNKYPECFLFGFHSGKSTFFGASPEKLIKIDSCVVEADALAGSAPRGNSEEEDISFEKELLESNKNRSEHQMVINHIVKQFSKISANIDHPSIPGIKKLNNIQHLWTPIRISVNPNEKIINIVELLHPTPAVCGLSVHDAIHTIKELEDYPRGLYAGVLGWFNNNCIGEFTVAIRSALLTGKKIYAFAGSGIVEGSDPNREYEETSLKLKPILSLFENENKD